MSLCYVPFKSVSLADTFFDSLKADYAEFESWFAKKADNYAYLSVNESGQIDGFLYLKVEDEPLSAVVPPLPAKLRLKVGTFKIDAHGTKLGDRFVKKLFDAAMANAVEEVYCTIFEKHQGLIRLLNKFGFIQEGTKTSPNGTEIVLIRSLAWTDDDLFANYPLVRLTGAKKYLLSLYPIWHTRLLPDSKLITEGPEIISDVSVTNSASKIYLAGRSNAANLNHGDVIVIYRTSDNLGPAYFRSVATSACVVDKVVLISSFKTEDQFVDYALPYSVFSGPELRQLYKSKKYPVVITFTYNISFPKRITCQRLLDEVGLDGNERWSCLRLTDEQFQAILKKGSVDARFIVN